MSDDKPATPASDGKATPVFDWANLTDLQEAKQGYERKPRIDVEADTPAPIMERIETSFKLNQPGDDGKIKTVWSLQECGSHDMAVKFVEYAVRYCKHRKAGQITLRKSRLGEDATAVRFAAKPFETREPRKPKPAETPMLAIPLKDAQAGKPDSKPAAPKPVEKPAPKPTATPRNNAPANRK